MARLKYLKYILIPFAAVLLMSHNVFADEFPAVETPLNGGYLSYNYSKCDYSYNTFENRPIYTCYGDYSLSATQWDTTTNDDGSITVHWRFNVGTPNDFTADDYIAISRLNFGGFDSITSNYTKPFFFNLSSPYAPYLGNARSLFFPDPGNRYSLTMGGFNSYFYNVDRGSYLSCPDMNSDECQFRYDWNTETGLGGFFYLSKNSGLPSNWGTIDSIYVVHNYYDSNNDGSYHWSPFSGSSYSVIYLMNPLQDATLLSNGYLYLDFYTTFYTTDDYFDMSASDTPGADVNDSIAVENISGQSPSDLNIGNSTTATNLISYISTFVQYITNVSPAQNCNLSLPFPNIMGGTAVANLCQGKDTMGNLIPVISSIVIFAFYIPFALFMLRIIYREIRSFTNG